MTRFLRDFGFVEGEASGEFRGAASSPVLVRVEAGPKDRLTRLDFAVASRHYQDAKANGAVEGEDRHGPFVSVAAPGDIRLDLRLDWPDDDRQFQADALTVAAPARVLRAGHAVLQTRDVDASVRFWRKWLGLIPSEIQCLSDGTPVVVFLRLNRGSSLADHHTLVIAQSWREGFDHVAYEVDSLDTVGFSHQHLRAQGWRHSWGIGRHYLGKQIFDYWLDPAGAHFEHYAEGERLTADTPPHYTPFSRASLYAWGEAMPADFGGKPRLREIVPMLRDIRAGRLDWKILRGMMRAAKAPPRPWLR